MFRFHNTFKYTYIYICMYIDSNRDYIHGFTHVENIFAELKSPSSSSPLPTEMSRILASLRKVWVRNHLSLSSNLPEKRAKQRETKRENVFCLCVCVCVIIDKRCRVVFKGKDKNYYGSNYSNTENKKCITNPCTNCNI